MLLKILRQISMGSATYCCTCTLAAKREQLYLLALWGCNPGTHGARQRSKADVKKAASNTGAVNRSTASSLQQREMTAQPNVSIDGNDHYLGRGPR